MSNPADRPIILAALTAFFVTLALVMPIVRVWILTKQFPLVAHRTPDPVARAAQFGVGVQLVGVILWTIGLVIWGPEPLGVWEMPDWGPLIGLILLGTGLLTVLIAQAQMGGSWRVGIDSRPTELVNKGMFKVVRNPIYAGVLCMLAGLVATAPSPWTIGFLVNSALLLSVEVRLEEAHLRKIHGKTYRSYAAKVGRFIPGVGKIAVPSEAS